MDGMKLLKARPGCRLGVTRLSVRMERNGYASSIPVRITFACVKFSILTVDVVCSLQSVKGMLPKRYTTTSNVSGTSWM